MKTYGYARVSTTGQAVHGNSLEAQKEALSKAGATEIYVDTFTGASTNRPQFSALISKLRPGDTVVVTKLDRFSRSMVDGVSIVNQLMSQGIRVYVLNMGIIENTPVGRMMMSVMFSMAEFEREMILERTMEGKEIAKQRPDFREGRPPIEDRVGEDAIREYIGKVSRGELTNKQAFTELGISQSTWYKVVKRYK